MAGGSNGRPQDLNIQISMPHPDKTQYLISYDISDDRRRNRLARLLEQNGMRVQWSVFECLMEGNRIEYLKTAIKEIIEPAEDSVRIYPLCAACARQMEALGFVDEAIGSVCFAF